MTMNTVELIGALEEKANDIRFIIESIMPSKGDKEEYCQRLCLLNRLSDFEYAINGITSNDLVEEDDEE